MKKALKIILGLILTVIIIVFGFIIYDRITSDNTYTISEKNLKIPIFVYHDIVENEDEVEFDYMQISKETFEEQILGLMKLGYKPISYEELIAYSKGDIAISKKSFLITFDDGYTGVYENAFEIAKKYNIPMTSFLIDDTVGIPGYYTWEQAKEMNDSGLMHIYSHGLSHRQYDQETTETLVNETEQAYTSLVSNLQDDELLKVFTYPYGLYTEEGRQALENKGYIQNLTDNKINTSNNLDLSGLHRQYPLSNSALKIFLITQYRVIKYK